MIKLQIVCMAIACLVVGHNCDEQPTTVESTSYDVRDPSLVHYGFQTENGYKRSEDIMIREKSAEEKSNEESKSKQTGSKASQDKPVEYRGGYSFISDDGYEYMVLYKANKNGFQPYVTAHKLPNVP